MERRSSTEQRLRRWLRSRHGVIGRAEALACGATGSVIGGTLLGGEWARIFPGVYRDTAVAESAHQVLRAVHVATGGRAVASHASAAWLWGLVDRPPAPELTVPAPAQHGRHLPGVTIHASADLDPGRIGGRQGIPVTDPLRTLVDLGASVPTDVLAHAVDQGLSSRLVTAPGLVAEIERLGRRGRPGPGVLRRVLRQRGVSGAPHPSMLESRALRLIEGSGLPRPVAELRAGRRDRYRLDFAYPGLRLAIEVDGYVWHSSPEQMRRDLARRNDLQRQGWLLLVYTWWDIVQEPGRVVAEIAATYARLREPASTIGGRTPSRPAPG